MSASAASEAARSGLARIVSWKRCGSWATRPTAACNESCVRSRTSSPSTRTAPSTTSWTRRTSIAIVVLPAPDGPTSATVSPGSMVNDTSRRISRSGRWSRLFRRLRATPATPGCPAGGGTRRGRTRSVRPHGEGRAPSDRRRWREEVEDFEDALERHERGQHFDSRSSVVRAVDRSDRRTRRTPRRFLP